jgi:UDP-N-acetylmuramate--alanine ligase
MTAPARQLFGRPVRRIHCLGVGGMGVAPLAIYLAGRGYAVSGEDDALTPEVEGQLRAAGVEAGGMPRHCDLVVRSSAIPDSHPGCAAARAGLVPLALRGEVLAEALRDLKLVAVCGAHGKTTTTAMIVTILRRCGFPCGYLVGGLPADGSPPAAAGTGEWVVAEVDESDGTIGRFSPEITVAVSADWDHPDHYAGEAAFRREFQELFARTRLAVVAARGWEGEGNPRLHTFGADGDFSGRICGGRGDAMELALGGRFRLRRALVRAQGIFNAGNATAALAAAELMGAAVGEDALGSYSGVRRRQSTVGTARGATVIEDYAHHPTEVRALLGSLRERLMRGSRLIVAFQPHRYSRTARFQEMFAQALSLADRVHLLDVYPAGESPVEGGTAADLAAALARDFPRVPLRRHPGPGDDLVASLRREVLPGDLVAFVGAGDLDRLARAWVERESAPERDEARWDAVSAALRKAVSSRCVLRREEAMAPRTTMRVGGPARLYAEPAGVEDVRALVRATSERGIARYLLGRGSNLIVPDEGVDGLVISLSGGPWEKCEILEGGRVAVGAGLRLKHLCGAAARAGLTGFEFLEGIPGSVGGALRMNAGAMGGWMFDVVEQVEVLCADGEVRTLPREQMNVAYRHCAELEGGIALSAVLRSRPAADPESVARQMDTYRRKRHESQPREPSAGCIFKNPPGDSAGRLIDSSGLKGERVGDAAVSRVHANFIVNLGSATGSDILRLARLVRDRVRDSKGVTLEPEALLYGRDWSDVL